jgi:hypothetical protein
VCQKEKDRKPFKSPKSKEKLAHKDNAEGCRREREREIVSLSVLKEIKLPKQKDEKINHQPTKNPP